MNVFANDGLVARKVSSTWTYYLFDPQGSVAQRTGNNGTVTSSSKYEAYGKHVNIPGSITDVYGWNARWGYCFDSETGLYLCQQRYYDSNQGRWLNRDPISYAGGINLYGYCGGNPTGWADPNGAVKIRAYWYGVGPGNHLGIQLEDNMGGGGETWNYGGGPREGKLVDKSASATNEFSQDYNGKRHPWKGTVVLVDDDSSYGKWRNALDDWSSDMSGIYDYGLCSVNSNTWAKGMLETFGLMDEWERAIGKRGGGPWLIGDVGSFRDSRFYHPPGVKPKTYWSN